MLICMKFDVLENLPTSCYSIINLFFGQTELDLAIFLLLRQTFEYCHEKANFDFNDKMILLLRQILQNDKMILFLRQVLQDDKMILFLRQILQDDKMIL